MATVPITPLRVDQVTPPNTTGKKSWLGVNPTSTISTTLAREGLQGYLGGDIAPHMGQIQNVLARHGYTDASWKTDLTGAQYNALLAEGANATGGQFTPWSTTTPGTTPPIVDPWTGTSTPAPTIDIPEYQGRGDFRFTGADLEQDPGYLRRKAAGEQALMHKAAASGNLRGGNFMRDLVTFNQELASDEFDRAYGRAADTYDRNVGADRYAHEAGVNRAQLQYAPAMLQWQRDRDEAFRRGELGFDRDWQREVYGRDDAWRRHQYANDDQWRRYALEEERRWRLANGGQV